jgi:hypothetical protein
MWFDWFPLSEDKKSEKKIHEEETTATKLHKFRDHQENNFVCVNFLQTFHCAFFQQLGELAKILN